MFLSNTAIVRGIVASCINPVISAFVCCGKNKTHFASYTSRVEGLQTLEIETDTCKMPSEFLTVLPSLIFGCFSLG